MMKFDDIIFTFKYLVNIIWHDNICETASRLIQIK